MTAQSLPAQSGIKDADFYSQTVGYPQSCLGFFLFSAKAYGENKVGFAFGWLLFANG